MNRLPILTRWITWTASLAAIAFTHLPRLTLRAATEEKEPTLHVVMILADDDAEIGPTVLFDARLIATALDTHLPAAKAAKPLPLLRSQNQLTIGRIVEAIQGLKLQPADTLFCFFSGRGEYSADGVGSLSLQDGTRFERSVLLSVLKSKNARLTMLATDCLSPDAALPLTTEILHVAQDKGSGSPAVSRLLFQTRGVIDVNAWSAGERAFYYQEKKEQGTESLGSIFVREFVRQLAATPPSDEKEGNWIGPLGRVQRGTRTSSEVAVGLRGLSDRKLQTPRVFVDGSEVWSFGSYITNSIGMKLRLIPAGEFMMGSPEDEKERSSEEGPVHRVRITKPFYLGAHEVTVGQFRKFVEAEGYRTEGERDGKGGYVYNASERKWEQKPEYTWRNAGFPQTDDHPVVIVSWNDAVAFAEWLTRKEGTRYRLPTEAEWEYACRAGTTTPFSFGSVLNGDQANCAGNYPYGTETKGPYKRETTPVGSYAPNAFGLYDMHGNVRESCADWYVAKYYGGSPSDDPPGAATGSYRVYRGGCWYSLARGCRAAYRNRFEPSGRDYGLGFRLARSVSSPSPSR